MELLILEDLEDGVVGGRGWRLKVLGGITGLKGLWGVVSGGCLWLAQRVFGFFCRRGS